MGIGICFGALEPTCQKATILRINAQEWDTAEGYKVVSNCTTVIEYAG
jgi:hypothetical protein